MSKGIPEDGLGAQRMLRIETIIGNARRLGIDAFHAAAALDLMAPIAGRMWIPLCCGCLDATEPALADALVHRIAMTIRHSAGGCARCSYSGCDTLVVSVARAGEVTS